MDKHRPTLAPIAAGQPGAQLLLMGSLHGKEPLWAQFALYDLARSTLVAVGHSGGPRRAAATDERVGIVIDARGRVLRVEMMALKTPDDLPEYKHYLQERLAARPWRSVRRLARRGP